MTFSELKTYLLAKPCTEETFPFGEGVHVFKVKGKMFALVGWHKLDDEEFMMVNLKCDPEELPALCDVYRAITPGYHMDKRHWISVFFDGSVPQGEVERLIDNSFQLVVAKMPKKAQQGIALIL